MAHGVYDYLRLYPAKHYRGTDKVPTWNKLNAMMLDSTLRYLHNWRGGSVVLRNTAKDCGLSGVKLAARRNVTCETVSRHMTGRSHMDVRDAVAYAYIMNIPPESLIIPPEFLGLALQYEPPLDYEALSLPALTPPTTKKNKAKKGN